MTKIFSEREFLIFPHCALVTSLVKTTVHSGKNVAFCQKSVRVNFRNFHIVHCTVLLLYFGKNFVKPMHLGTSATVWKWRIFCDHSFCAKLWKFSVKLNQNCFFPRICMLTLISKSTLVNYEWWIFGQFWARFLNWYH